MKLVWANEQNTTISVTLDEGETLGHLSGPVTATVPVDPANTDYAAILAQKLEIEPHGGKEVKE